MGKVILNMGYGPQGAKGAPKRQSLKDKAYAYLKEKIIKCEFAPGMPLSERDLMEELGVSRTPIRDAINLLEQENLVRVYPQRGIFVEHITVKDIQDIFMVRKVVEPLVTKLATLRIPDDVLEELDLLYQNLQPPIDPEKHMENDRRFHTTIAQFCDNRYLEQILVDAYDRNSRVRYLSLRSNIRLKEAIEEHKPIIKHLRNRDAEAAGEAMLQHIVKAGQVAEELLKLQP